MPPSVFSSSIFSNLDSEPSYCSFAPLTISEIRFANFGIVNERKFEMQPNVN